jgi:predicted nucleic acid-binding Zn ribbon protein
MDRERWRRAVGDRIAARAEPGWLKGSVLTVIAASSAWAQELSLLGEEIRRRLGEHGLRVEGIRFVVREGAGYQYAQQRKRERTRG